MTYYAANKVYLTQGIISYLTVGRYKGISKNR